jgi:hypothetical protein
MKISSDNKIREKIDGFTLDKKNNNNPENSFITTDQGVYSKPDDNYNTNNKQEK